MVHPQKMFYLLLFYSLLLLHPTLVLTLGKEKTPTKILIPTQQSKLYAIPWNY
jgi:hypothetical protein